MLVTIGLVAGVGAGDKAGVYHALDRDTGAVVWETTLTPGSFFGGEIGSAAYVDGKLVTVSNVGNPATNAPTNVAKVFALDPASGDVLWEAEPFPGLIFAPVGAVRGVVFVGTDRGTLAALDTAPARGCGPTTPRPGPGAGRRSWTAVCSGATASLSSAARVRGASSASRSADRPKRGA